MWPNQPSTFESLFTPPDGLDKDRSWYFVCIDGQIGGRAEAGRLEPIDRDAYRWLDVDVTYEHFLGVFEDRPCYAVAASGKLPQGYSLGNLRSWLGRVDPGGVLSRRTCGTAGGLAHHPSLLRALRRSDG